MILFFVTVPDGSSAYDYRDRIQGIALGDGDTAWITLDGSCIAVDAQDPDAAKECLLSEGFEHGDFF